MNKSTLKNSPTKNANIFHVIKRQIQTTLIVFSAIVLYIHLALSAEAISLTPTTLKIVVTAFFLIAKMGMHTLSIITKEFFLLLQAQKKQMTTNHHPL